jgi:hypothetical protein
MISLPVALASITSRHPKRVYHDFPQVFEP